MLVAFLIVVSLFGGCLTYFFYRWKHLPPGPFPLPILGHYPLLVLARKIGYSSLDIMRWLERRYGKIFTLWYGNTPIVHIGDYKLAQDAFIRMANNFLERSCPLKDSMVREGRGLIFSNDNHHHEQRLFAIHVLNLFGSGDHLQSIAMEELEHSCNYLDYDKEIAKGTAFVYLQPMFQRLTGNILNRILFSGHFPKENTKIFEEMVMIMGTVMENRHLDVYVTSWNWWLPPFTQHYTRMEELLENFRFLIKLQLEERIARVANGERNIIDKAEDVVDAYLQLDNIDKDIFNEDSLVITLMDFWFAGQQTISSLLYWAFDFLALHPLELGNIHDELDTVTGRSRSLLLSDRRVTPIFNASIMEILRLSSVYSQTFWRKASEDTIIGDCAIRRGTLVTAQLDLINTDPKQFEDPEEFQPERFLDKPALETLIASFGFGKRSCMGEKTVMDIAYLVMGNLLVCYNVMADPKKPPKTTGLNERNTVRHAPPYGVYLSQRPPLSGTVTPSSTPSEHLL